MLEVSLGALHVLTGLVMTAAAVLDGLFREETAYRATALAVVMGLLGILLLVLECIPSRSGCFCARYFSTLNTHVGRGAFCVVVAVLLLDVAEKPPIMGRVKPVALRGKNTDAVLRTEGIIGCPTAAYRVDPAFLVRERVLWGLCGTLAALGAIQLIAGLFTPLPVSRCMRAASDDDDDDVLWGGGGNDFEMGFGIVAEHPHRGIEPAAGREGRISNSTAPAASTLTRQMDGSSGGGGGGGVDSDVPLMSSMQTSLSPDHQRSPDVPLLPPSAYDARFNERRGSTAYSVQSGRSLHIPGTGELEMSSDSEKSKKDDKVGKKMPPNRGERSGGSPEGRARRPSTPRSTAIPRTRKLPLKPSRPSTAE